MLTHSKLQTIVWTSRPAEAERFYTDVLGLQAKGRSDGAVIYNVSGSELRVSPVLSTEPTAHTVVGFAVEDLPSAMRALEARGVVWQRFPGLPHDQSGVLVTPDRAQVAWFRDPDGNLLSIVQYP